MKSSQIPRRYGASRRRWLVRQLTALLACCFAAIAASGCTAAADGSTPILDTVCAGFTTALQNLIEAAFLTVLI